MTTMEGTQERWEQRLERRDFRALREEFRECEPADLGEVLSQVEVASCIMLFRLVPRGQRSEVFAHLVPERQLALLEELPAVVVTAFVGEMDPDDRTRLLERLQPEIRERVLQNLDPEKRLIAWKLLSYPEESVGRLMNPQFLSVPGDLTVARALEAIRWSAATVSGDLYSLFVVDRSGILIGEVNLAALVLCDPLTRPVTEIMKARVVALDPYDEERSAVDAFKKYDRHQMPVVDENRRLLGVVTADDVFDVAEEEATEDIQQFGGQESLDESYFQTSFLAMIRKRLGWLVILFIGGFISCYALRTYEELLSRWSFLMVFLPIVISAGGNSGTQAASLIIRGMAINEMRIADWRRILGRELLIGLVLGAVLAMVGFGRATLWGLSPEVGLIIAISVVIVVAAGAVAGSMLPLVFKTLRLDPAVVSSPFITTVLDVTGILVFITVARLIMGWVG